MPFKVKLSKDAIQEGRIIPNGWYDAIITDTVEDTDKNGAQMLIVTYKVRNHPEYEGVPIRQWLCTEWFGGGDKIRRYVEAVMGVKFDLNKDYDLMAGKGITVKIYNTQSNDQNGRPQNGVADIKHKDATV